MKSFTEYDSQHPHIWVLFKSIAMDYIRQGRKRISSKLIIEEIRYHYFTKTNDYIKVNNIYTSWYSRKFALEFPQYAGVFKFNPLKNIREQAK